MLLQISWYLRLRMPQAWTASIWKVFYISQLSMWHERWKPNMRRFSMYERRITRDRILGKPVKFWKISDVFQMLQIYHRLSDQNSKCHASRSKNVQNDFNIGIFPDRTSNIFACNITDKNNWMEKLISKGAGAQSVFFS